SFPTRRSSDLFQNARFQGQFEGCQMARGKLNGQSLDQYFENNAISLDYFTEEVWAIATPELIEIRHQLELIGQKLRKWNLNISYGIKTGLNKAFILDKSDAENLLVNKKNLERLKPMVRGRDTRTYYTNDSFKWIIISPFRDHQILIKDYPEIYEYLKNFEESLKKRGQVQNGQHHWLELDNNPSLDYFNLFEQPKIVFSEIVSEPQFCLDTNKFYPEATTFFIYGENLKWLTALLNSEPIT